MGSQKGLHWQAKQKLPCKNRSQEGKPSTLAVEESSLRDAQDPAFRSVTEEDGISQPELNAASFFQPSPTVMTHICQPIPTH